MSEHNRNWLRGVLAACAIGAVVAPAFAFFPPVIAPINRPIVITKKPSAPDPVKVPPVDPCVKPKPKPRPKQDHCGGCPVTGTASTPEPATLISAGIGMALAGLAGWAKRRRKAI